LGGSAACWRLALGEACPEVSARGEVQLLEDVREVCLDCPPGDEELLGDLGVAVPLRGERRNSMFGGSE